MGKLASIFIGAYYLYVVGRWLLTTLFSLKVLYEEHGFGTNLLWGLGPGQGVFPMHFYRRWRRFKQHLLQTGGRETPQVPPRTVPHEYLAMDEVEMPPLPQRNPVRPGMYPELPSAKPAPDNLGGPSHGHYTRPERRSEEAPLCQTKPGPDVSSPPTPMPTTVTPAGGPIRMAPPAAATSVGNEGLVGLPNPQTNNAFRPPEDTFPKGPIGEVMKPRP